MSRKRFLRDNVLDDMLNDIRMISGRTAETGFPTMVFSQALVSLSELYETNKVVMVHLEEVIDKLRVQGVDSSTIDQVVEATAHIQVGLVTVHSALKKDVQSILDGVEQFRKSLGIDIE
jgi:hypothetical protein